MNDAHKPPDAQVPSPCAGAGLINDCSEIARLEQAQQLFATILTAFWANFAGATCLAFIMIGTLLLSPSIVIVWLAVMFALSFNKYLTWISYRRREWDHALAVQWFRWAQTDAFLVSLTWGFALANIIIHGPASQKLLTLMGISMLAVGGLFTYGSDFRSFILFITPLSLMTAIALISQPSIENTGLAGGVTVLYTLLFKSGKKFHQNHTETLMSRFYSEQLAVRLEEQRQKADSANQSKSRLLAVASHDLRLPLCALSLYLAELEEQDLDEAQMLPLIHSRECVSLMEQMFADLMDFSRIDSHQLKPQIQKFQLSEILHRTKIEFEPLAREKNLKLIIKPCALECSTDFNFLDRIVRNLVSNAIHYTDQGVVWIACRESSAGITIAICDTGRGIPKEGLSEIFKDFIQLPSSVSPLDGSRSDGIGLGLSIVEGLCRLLNAKISVTSNPNRGSRFVVTLPTPSLLPEPELQS